MSVIIEPENRVIRLNDPPVSGQFTYDVVEDIYSEVKQQWLATEAYTRLIFPFEPLGGNPLGGTLFLGKYVFIRNDLGWHIHPYAADHEVIFVGNLYPADPDLPRRILEPQPGNTISAVFERSSLTQLAETPVSGLTADEALNLERIRKAILNEQKSDPATGLRVIYEDDDVTVATSARIFEDTAKTQPYQGTGVEAMERLFST